MARPVDESVNFTRGDLRRLLGVAAILVLALTVVLGADILPAPVAAQVGTLVPQDIRAPRTQIVVSALRTAAAREAARAAVPPQYDYTTEKAIALAAEQTARLRGILLPVETAFAASTTAEQRDRKSTRLNSSHSQQSRMPSSA